MHEAAQERFWAKVDKTGTCWLWTAAKKKPEGYGFFKIRPKMLYAHRVSWEIANGQPIPQGLCVCHHCDTPGCVRPDHLFLGTHAANIKDRDSKGRQASGLHNGKYTKPEKTPCGERHHKSKLTEDDVREIRRVYDNKKTRVSQQFLADHYGVSQNQISMIVLRKNWRHVK